MNSDHKHQWVYGGSISGKYDSDQSNWNRKCVICKQVDDVEESCNHAWGFKGTFGKEDWKKSCHICGYDKSITLNEVFNNWKNSKIKEPNGFNVSKIIDDSKRFKNRKESMKS